MSSILANFYTADITSMVIRPSPDDIIGSLSQLQDSNYSPHEYISQKTFRLVSNTVKSLEQNSGTQKAMESLLSKFLITIES